MPAETAFHRCPSSRACSKNPQPMARSATRATHVALALAMAAAGVFAFALGQELTFYERMSS
jgi:hypothetical protein